MLSFVKINAPEPRRRGDRRETATRAAGRYDGRSSNTRLPATGLARMPASRNVDDVVAAVEDPWGDGKQRIYATVNRRVDVLEMERSHGRISEAAYHTGRIVQATFEKLGRLPGSKWDTTPGDRFTAQRSMIEHAMDRAVAIQGMVDHIQGRIGMIDTRLLRRVLGDRLSFAECAALQGKSGDKGQNYVSRRFRDALEDLAEAWTAKGKIQTPPVDKHGTAASGVHRRQAVALGGGKTLERLETELAELLTRKAKPAEARREIGLLRERIEGLRQARAVNSGAKQPRRPEPAGR